MILDAWARAITIIFAVLAIYGTHKWLVARPGQLRFGIETASVEAIWIRVLLFQAGLWAVALLFGCFAIFHLWTKSAPTGYGWVASGFALASLIWLGYQEHQYHRGDEEKLFSIRDGALPGWPSVKTKQIPRFAGIGILVAVVQLAGLMFVGGALNRLAQSTEPVTVRIDSFNELRSFSEMFLLATSMILTAGVIGTELRRRTANAVNMTDLRKEIFPREYVILFGLTYTALLAIAYVPINFTLMGVGEKIVMSATQSEAYNLKPWLELRKAVTDSLGLTATGILPSGAFAVLSPLLGGIFAGLLGKEKQ